MTQLSSFARRRGFRNFSWLPTLALGAAALLGTACSDDDDGKNPPANGTDGGGGEGAGGEDAVGAVTPPSFALSSMVFDDANTSTYVSLLDGVDLGDITLDDAREFPGAADLWLHDGSLFLADSESKTIAKLEIQGRNLEPVETAGFTNYGVTDFGFWRNAFIAKDKALFISGTSEYIVWDPTTVSITGSFEIPALPAQDGLEPYAAYSDRAALVRDGLLYQPVYYTDDTFFQMAGVSSILVADPASEEVQKVIEAPCPGLDFATRDEDDNLYFSSWVFAPGGAAVLDQPATCVVKLAAGSDEPEVLFNVADVADGREGGVFRYLGDGKAYLSILHAERSDSEDASEVADGPNWRFWLYDFKTGAAEPVEGIDYNAGAAYATELEGKPYILVPAGDYRSTQLFAVDGDGTVEPKLTSPGWSLRLFDLR